MLTQAPCRSARQDGPQSLTERFERLPGAALIDELRIERGGRGDYQQLASFHYKSGRPGAVTAVYRMVHRAPTVVGRFVGRPDETTIVGVLIRSLPSLGCQLRDRATSDRYRGMGVLVAAAMVNREVRTISRVVIHPQWRGIGLAVRLVRHPLVDPETEYTEALAAMGRVHPFFERAGMVRYDRPPRPEYARLLDAFDRLDFNSGSLASLRLVLAALETKSADDRRWLESELRRWHRAAFRTTKERIAAMSLAELLAAARDRLLSQPVYYLYHHGST